MWVALALYLAQPEGATYANDTLKFVFGSLLSVDGCTTSLEHYSACCKGYYVADTSIKIQAV